MPNSIGLSNLSKLFLVTALALTLTACASNKEIKVVTTSVKSSVQKQTKPRALNIGTPKFLVITAANFDQYKEKLLTGNLLIVGMSETDYKLLLKNQAEYKRYIEQQKSIIVYYENNL